ncbi:alpha-galactosidase-like [Neltuma alba]|uniref:alpha-galactosidase-like n=1 Tax=Neltuma alba TaxID=207710 RepID=UPI0010A3FA05|nr:alpha-galactosidase-like [Prosopis alba]
MEFSVSFSFFFLVCLFTQSVLSQNAMTPPRGWNSYDSFSWIISEGEFLQNAEVLSKRLLPFGYEYAVVDFLWYRSLDGGDQSFGKENSDGWGRLHPDGARWPSSIGGKGFKAVADIVHSMGVKFGIHLMAGISSQAVRQNTPILDTNTGGVYKEDGREWHAGDIGIESRACSWMPESFMAINLTLGAGKAYLKSVYDLYASWNVDFVKLDCVFGENFDVDEITTISGILKELNRPILLSLSPGVSATPQMAQQISGMVNMYRVTGDDWDQWQHVADHFDVARNFAAAELIGSRGLNGRSWPDLDMLPFGWLTDPGVKQGPHRFTDLSLTEQTTQMTLWSIAKSPLMYGGDLRNLDEKTFNLITNPTVLQINSHSANNTGLPFETLGLRSWMATGNDGKVYVAYFNLNQEISRMVMNMSALGNVLLAGRSLANCNGQDVWNENNKVTNGTIFANVGPHGCSLFVLTCT